ncbi:MAG TPA: cytochrome P450 [Kofleriaceae bacterium]|nr:cytochrome P450 [Kofleriaceae bacterium]
MNLSDIDILDPDRYVTGVPYDQFELLRREAPVFWHHEPGGPGFWAITRHDDVVAIALDAKTFSSERGGTQIPDLPKDDIRVSPDNLVTMDPPRHGRYRALVASVFTPKSIDALKGFVTEVMTDILDRVAPLGRCDLVADISAYLPATVIMKMVGVPAGDRAQIESWVKRLLSPDDPDFASSPEDRASITQQFMAYAHDLAKSRHQDPRDDLLSRLMAAEVNGATLTYEEFGMFFMLLLAAGTDTTRHLLANGSLELLGHPEVLARLREDPARWPGAVEEMLRLCPPMFHIRRTATRDCTVRGQKIEAGQKVVLWWVSANRDENVFPEPNTFDIDREPNNHMSFGHGPHSCLGNALARLQARIAFAELFTRLPDMACDGPVQRLRSNWLNGVKKMPIRFSPP